MDNVLRLPVNEYWYNLIKEGKLIKCGDMKEIKGDKSLENVFMELEK